jgi:uncharacterized protein
MNQTDPISPIDTRTAAFIGHVPGSVDPPGTIYIIKSWTEFSQKARLAPGSGSDWNDLAHAVNGFFLNGGSICVVAESGAACRKQIVAALDGLSTLDDISILAAPGMTDAHVYAAVTQHCETRRDRVAILDGPARLDDDVLKVLAGQADEAGGWRMPPPSAGGFTTFYAPWIHVTDPVSPGDGMTLVSPSGYIAGAWARNDTEQGVHKAPAGLSLTGALDVGHHFTSAEQEKLNPRGVNAIRVFPGRGVLVWGARTLSPDPEWRYVNVRRFVIMITGSICRQTSWVVFEPNDEPLWGELRTRIEHFLFGLWRDGMFPAARPEHAYFVRCDRSTMTQADIDAGRLVVLIGLAVVRPAEFTILRLVFVDGECEVG